MVLKKGSVVVMDAFYRETWAEIDVEAIFQNVNHVRELIPGHKTLMAVVKANAYGHGDKEVAEIALQAGADMLAVAFLDEAIALRKKGIKESILVLGAVPTSYIQTALEWEVTVTAYSKAWIEEAASFLGENSRLHMHLKIDTGMGRLGIRTKEELHETMKIIASHSGFVLDGVFTHFATADELNSSYFEEQYTFFEEMIRIVKEYNFTPPMIHCANSAALLRRPKDIFNGVRLGISMYGLSPSEELKEVLPIPLKQAFSLHSRIVHVKKVKKGSHISYGATYEAKEDEWIATIPVGYADGWIRKLSNFEVLVDGVKVPIVGRICMDQLMIKLPKMYKMGTKVTFIGKQKSAEITIDEVAKHLETINYEIPCMIAARVPRVYTRDSQHIDVNNYILR
ncbi:alanine racemase [Priestia megaterium]|uniref:alanine racemase n=2 Tax=Priestia megaterium TaxID=1404 RepID=UPI000EFA1CE2|nr:alanine racemase [Priestia megaterium]RMA84365.1 alanine racemase [Priestia megaterium]